MKHILVFGDSNTHGSIPGGGGRYGWDTRWPGRLQALLGEGYRIIEEGLGGRTTVFDDPLEPGRSGREYFGPCLRSHSPLDLVVISLGTNDTKVRFGVTAPDIARGARILGEMAQAAEGHPRVLIVSPIRVGGKVGQGSFTGMFDHTSVEKSERLYEAFRREMEPGWALFDAASVACPSEADQLHMDAQSHDRLARALADTVRAILG